MRRKNTTTIDSELCNGCGLCVKVCPSEAMELVDGKAVVTGEHSLGCDHCAAICPTGAISVGFVDDDAVELANVEVEDRWLPYGQFDVPALVALMRSRRSCRDFSDEPVPRSILEDLVKIGQMAPSGTNSQLWTFTILPNRDAVMTLGAALAGFYRKLNKMAARPTARLFAKLFLKDSLGEYYRDYYESVEEGIRQYDETGRDRLFHGAPAVIVIGSGPGASCPAEDALLASQNILLAAHAMGYTTCLIGFAVEAMKHDRKIKQMLGIPDDEIVYSVIALGNTKMKYGRFTRRRTVKPRYFGAAGDGS